MDGDGKLNHTYSLLGVETYKQTSTEPLPAGDVKKVVFDLKPAHHKAEKALHEHEQVQAVGAGAAG